MGLIWKKNSGRFSTSDESIADGLNYNGNVDYLYPSNRY